MTTFIGYAVHPSHRFIPADDIYECAYCVCRPYNDEAKQPCPMSVSKTTRALYYEEK